MKKETVLKGLLLALIFVTLVFIFGNSVLSGKQSSAISNFVMRLLGIRRKPSGGDSVHTVRKLGHFLEFLALGAELSLFFFLQIPKKQVRFLALACCGMFAPIADETIQIFNDRNPQIVDIWIDIAGFTLGSAILLAAAVMVLWLRGRRDLSKQRSI